MEKKATKKKGVFYKAQDYANLWKRSLSWLIDLTVLLLLAGALCYCSFYLIEEEELALKISFFGSVFVSYVYLAILKSSEIRTLGFRISDIKIVNLYGDKPSWATMLVRFLLLSVGPFELIVDILWLTGEPTKQTLRDKYMGTYVIKNHSKPCGTGFLRNVSLDFLGWHLIFREVVFAKDKEIHKK